MTYSLTQSFKDWLGLAGHTTVAGLHVDGDRLSLVAVRPGPVRVVAVARRPVTDAAVVDGEIRVVPRVAVAVREMVAGLKLPPDLGLVAAIEPAEDRVTALDDGGEAVVTVRRAAQDRLRDTVHRAGLRLLGIDPAPLALARVARLAGPDPAAVQGAFRWSVLTGTAYTEAERSDRPRRVRLGVGPDLTTLRPLAVDDLPIEVPRRLRPLLDLDRDAIALGAALAACNLPPVVDVRPAVEAAAHDWALQPVGGTDVPAGSWPAPTGRPSPTDPQTSPLSLAGGHHDRI